MIAYAIRFDIDEIILFYPNTIKENQENRSEFTIRDELANGKDVSIKAFQVPVLNAEILHENLRTDLKLNDLFADTKQNLKEKLCQILNNEMNES